MLEMLREPFMLRALAGGLMMAVIASYYGVFVVQRSMSFMGSGLAHAAFGGVALGLLLEVNPLWLALPFTVITALGISWLQRYSKLEADTAIGIFFALSMAMGIIFLELRRQFSADAFSYLFGSVLHITTQDLIVTGVFLLMTLGSLPWWGRWAYATFDRDLARADRHAVARDDYLLSVALAVCIVIGIKLLGIILIASFLVIPPATARLISRTLWQMTLRSIAIGLLSVCLGLLASAAWDLPSGATIILTQSLLFFIALGLRRQG